MPSRPGGLESTFREIQPGTGIDSNQTGCIRSMCATRRAAERQKTPRDPLFSGFHAVLHPKFERSLLTRIDSNQTGCIRSMCATRRAAERQKTPRDPLFSGFHAVLHPKFERSLQTEHAHGEITPTAQSPVVARPDATDKALADTDR